MARPRLLVSAVFVALSGVAKAFYLPGVAPIDYARVRVVTPPALC